MTDRTSIHIYDTYVVTRHPRMDHFFGWINFIQQFENSDPFRCFLVVWRSTDSANYQSLNWNVLSNIRFNLTFPSPKRVDFRFRTERGRYRCVCVFM